MAWTSHGYHIEGTERDDVYRPVQVARCGGPELCGKCSAEQARVLQKLREQQTREVEEHWKRKPVKVTAIYWDGSGETVASIITWLRANLARDAFLNVDNILFEVGLTQYVLRPETWVVIHEGKIEILTDEYFQDGFEPDTERFV